jgi:hypothetical protein
MYNYNEIIDKLKDIISEKLGNNKIPHYEIMSFLTKRNISINLFFFKQLPESLLETTSNYIILKYQKSVIASAFLLSL